MNRTHRILQEFIWHHDEIGFYRRKLGRFEEQRSVAIVIEALCQSKPGRGARISAIRRNNSRRLQI